ncbi:MAG TPA: hypothetical protein PK772_03240 [Chitinophagaceae bacterium]|mgnify:CR=1 FL=1|nr:hypothetical protein [Chitinophagaceae bacterium]
MIKKIALTLFSLWLTIITYAQSTISGNIKINRNKPIIGASISLKDSYDGATTDSSGSK